MSKANTIPPVAVRELCSFTAKCGDIDLRFTPSPTSEEGIHGHQLVTRGRGDAYTRELPLQGQVGELRIRGRADGLSSQPLRLEEIKTHRSDLGRQPDNHRQLHWAQLKVYGALLAAERGLESLALRLCYYQVDSGQETHFDQVLSRAELDDFLALHAKRYSAWHRQQAAHRLLRNECLRSAGFPHDAFHGGQRQLAEAVYRSVSRGQSLLAQAPTGIGKSLGSLFPALKAMAQGKVEKIYFLTAKTSGRQAALAALELMAEGSKTSDVQTLWPLRVLELVAREKACEHPDKACHGESCPLAKGFYDRLPAARAAATEWPQLGQSRVREVALAHQVCPYYLSQEMARWADVIVGDYNYYFDQTALLHSLMQLNEWPVAVLVDEAHNLVERGRTMYSCELRSAQLALVRVLAPAAIKRAISKASSAWRALQAEQADDFHCLAAPPAALLTLLQALASKLGQHFAEQPSNIEPELQRLFFDLLRFLELAEDFGPHALCILQREPPAKQGGTPAASLSICNVVPARYLKPRIASAQAVLAFSATLQPALYYRELLGFAAEVPWLDVPSPFGAQQLELQLVTQHSTRLQDRARSATAIAQLIAQRYATEPGNYLAFFSSYAYLNQVLAALQLEHPALPLRVQGRGMSEDDRKRFIDGFTPESSHVGLAVLGGAFAEGIDLPGQRLIGVFVASLGLPPFDALHEAMRQQMSALFGPALADDFTYLYPGLQKVVQAAGRVIRSLDDRGAIVLIDHRYARRKVRELLPSWWLSETPSASAAAASG